METHLAAFVKDTPHGQEAEAILRKCVHCGFCLATCPTYQLLGDELDSPRGRIYLVKGLLEGGSVTHRTRRHLDRCLTCGNCETTCPSGVQYVRLLDIGRELAEERAPRPVAMRWMRSALAAFLTSPRLFRAALWLGQQLRPLLPRSMAQSIPQRRAAGAWPMRAHARRVLLPGGCVQKALMPGIDASAARVLDEFGVGVIRPAGGGCCGALRFHLGDQRRALEDMRRNIDAWWPHLEAGAEAIVTTASGCGVTVKEYGYYLRHDPTYAVRAARVSALARDLVEVLVPFRERIAECVACAPTRQLAWHPPCTLQHGQRLRDQVEALLLAAGAELDRKSTRLNSSH